MSQTTAEPPAETTRQSPIIRPLGRPGDLGWVVMAHGEVYAQEFGWNTEFEALVAQIVADYARAARGDSGDGSDSSDAGDGSDHDGSDHGNHADPPTAGPRHAAWIAERDGARAGCVFCVPDPADESAAKLRILLVQPSARGHGLGGRLVDTCLRFARDAGYERARLWTNHPLKAARAIYLSRGFRLTAEEPHHSFGVDLVGQTYELDLASARIALSAAPDRKRG